MTSPIAGRVVAVTGGARGIGRDIARVLAEAGARVAVGDRDEPAAIATAAELSATEAELSGTAAESSGTVRGFALDVTDTESFRTFLAAVETLWGPIDVLVNNAG